MSKQNFPHGLRALMATAVLLATACTAETDSGPVVDGDEAVEIWAYADTVGVRVYTPLDLKSAGRDVAWGVDGISGTVIRYEASEGTSGVIGLRDSPPAQIVKPARLAVGEVEGIFVYDDSTGMVDLYSPGGQHLRGFDPGLRPSILEISHRPLRLTYGVRTFGTDSIPTLSVIQTDFRGASPDTLLSPDAGPESLRDAPAVRTQLVSTPATGGLWIFAAAISDTVFEVAGSGSSRKLVLPEADTLRSGILADLQQEILWVAVPRPEGGLYYEAYDISGDADTIDGAQVYLGVRTTPEFFIPTSAYDGTVTGWWRSPNAVHAPRAYDMRIDALREGIEEARAVRTARRDRLASDWELAIQRLEEAEEERRRQMEAVREEEGLE
jgi:hypothetical protein